MGACVVFSAPAPPPDLCTVHIGNLTDPVPNFCTLAGVGGDADRAKVCATVNSAGELVAGNQTAACGYDSCTPGQEQGGCCPTAGGGTCCAIAGAGTNCIRAKFTGDPLACCLQNYNCNPSNVNLCFSDASHQNTCSDGFGVPNYRNTTSTNCHDSLLLYCSGTLPTDDPNSHEWLSRWQPGVGGRVSCIDILRLNMFSIPGQNQCNAGPDPVAGVCNIPLGSIPISAPGYFYGQSLVSAAVAHYSAQGLVLGSLPGFQGFNPFQDLLYSNVCCPYPGLCQPALEQACSLYTAQRISLNPAVTQWCGCHLPQGEYEAYSAKFNIPPQCTPMCNRVNTIPIVGIDAQPVLCQQNVCLIDNIAVNLVNSQIGGAINFNQICGSCGGSSSVASNCSCIVTNNTVDITNSTIGGNFVPISQNCGNFTCTQTNPSSLGPVTINVPCATGTSNPFVDFQAKVAAAEASARKTSIIITLIVVGIALVVIFALIYFFSPNFYPREERTLALDPGVLRY